MFELPLCDEFRTDGIDRAMSSLNQIEPHQTRSDQAKSVPKTVIPCDDLEVVGGSTF